MCTLRICSRPRISGSGNHHLAVEAARTQQRRIEHVRTVGRGDDDHALADSEAVHLDQHLVQGLFASRRCRRPDDATLEADRVDFIDEDDAKGVLLAFSNMSRTRAAPTNISTKSGRDAEDGTLASPAMALASSVLPVPGEADHQHAARMRPPSFWNLLGRAEIDQLLGRLPWLRRSRRRRRKFT